LSVPARDPSTVIDDFDYCFAENGLTAYKLGKQLDSASFIKHIGEDNYKEMVKVILHYIADLDIPVKRWDSYIQGDYGRVD
jgi:phosphomannomutase